MNPNQSIIDSGWKFVLAVSGGGQEAIGELTRHGGMSSSLLEAIVPYAVPAFESLIGGKVDSIVSSAAARAAAMACYIKAKKYDNNPKMFGLASTGSVVRVGGEREGRRHKVYMAIQDASRTIAIDIEYKAGRTREEEETLTSNLIKVALLWGSHTFADMQKFLTDEDSISVNSFVAEEELRELMDGVIGSTHALTTPHVIFSSSCNPLHDGHLRIMEDAHKRTGLPVCVELCIKNPDKPPLDYLTISERRKRIDKKISMLSCVPTLVITNEPLFVRKAMLFRGSTFAMGRDTYDRVMHPKYYPNEMGDVSRIWDVLEACDCRILVYPRKGYLPDYTSSPYATAVEFVTDFDPSEISSTSLRKNGHV